MSLSMAELGAPPTDRSLPALREDLQIADGAARFDGEPTWLIHDPAQNRYFDIDRPTLEALSHWGVGSSQKLIETLKREVNADITPADIDALINFLHGNFLTIDPANEGGFASLFASEQKKRSHWLMKIIRTYMFFRIPLFRPNRFLATTYPSIRFLFTTQAVIVFAVLAIIGLFLVSRQWEQFAGAFQFLLSIKGAIIYGASLVFIKSLHELGHAYMAHKFGLKVPAIGAAFILLIPILYTDTSDAWRLKSRRQRLLIDSAGILVELALASIATFVWVFLPDGGLRTSVFAIATTSWLTSLLVNLNPFMRFDGYYILSDFMKFENMQSRSFALLKWRLREFLFRLREPAPDDLPALRRRMATTYAFLTGLYRLILYFGIAYVAYSFFFKALGLLMFAAVFSMMMVKPLVAEIRVWWEKRMSIFRSFRTYITVGIVAFLVALAVLPLSATVVVPAILKSRHEASLHAPVPAQVASVNVVPGEMVATGMQLFQLRSDQLEQELLLINERIEALNYRLQRSGADKTDRAASMILKNELSSARERRAGMERQSAKLSLAAPISGQVADMDREIQPGMWVNPDMLLARVRGHDGDIVKGYVGEAELGRLVVGAPARFIPNDPQLPSLDTEVTEIAPTAVEWLEEPYLATKFDGPIAVLEAGPDKLVPSSAHYSVYFKLVEGQSIDHEKVISGIAVVKGARESFFERAREHILKVVIRELGL